MIAGVEPYVSRERSNCCFGSQVCSTIAVSITTVGEVYGVVAHIRRERVRERERELLATASRLKLEQESHKWP